MSLHGDSITFLFTDIEGSTRLWEEQPATMEAALASHDLVIRTSIEANGGTVFKTIGDAFCAAFPTAHQALEAALSAQEHLWHEGANSGPLVLNVRMALHTGAAQLRDKDYFGPTLNRVARLLSLANGGQVLLSATTQEAVGDFLPRGMTTIDLGMHRLKDLERAEHIYQLAHPKLPSDFPAFRRPVATPHNLPTQLTSFVGRGREVETVKRLLADTRCLTLTGAGGTGKTRLALETAGQMADEFTDGIWLVDFAPVADPDRVTETVAAVLKVRENGSRSLRESVSGYLKGRSVLLILDNCEHLVWSCADLVEKLLQTVETLRVIATSREALGIAGEKLFPVAPLAPPVKPGRRAAVPLTGEVVSESPAVQLFVARTRLALPDFSVTAENAAAVAQICWRLDGIPLAIELAAARMKALPVQQFAERLDDMFRLLTVGRRTALPRQQTLQAMVDWSHGLLLPKERTLLRRLSVFAGGWTLEAAEGICADGAVADDAGADGAGADGAGADGAGADSGGEPPIEPFEVLELLTGLVDKSLVLYEDREERGRYRMLETIRQYARDRLLEHGEAVAFRDRHLAFYLRVDARVSPLQIVSGSEILLSHYDNLMAALEWCLSESRHSAAGLRIAGALAMVWLAKGLLTDGRHYLKEFLCRPVRPEDAGVELDRARASALRAAGWLAWNQNEPSAARSMLEESLALWRSLSDESGIAACLGELGLVARSQRDYAAARTLFNEGLHCSQRLGDPMVAALNQFRLGTVASSEGDYPTAESLQLESLAVFRQVDLKPLVAIVLNCLGRNAALAGDLESGYRYCVESIRIAAISGNDLNQAMELEGLAGVLAALDLPLRAARLFGAAEAMRERMSNPRRDDERDYYDRFTKLLRQSHDQAGIEAAWQEGRTLSLEEAADYATEHY